MHARKRSGKQGSVSERKYKKQWRSRPKRRRTPKTRLCKPGNVPRQSGKNGQKKRRKSSRKQKNVARADVIDGRGAIARTSMTPQLRIRPRKKWIKHCATCTATRDTN